MQASSIQTGPLIGGILLIAGCCIGAGMLGLPVLSAKAGFIPSTLTFLIGWLFMVATGLLVAEVTSWFKDEINVTTMARRTLGRVGQIVAWFVFLFLFYSLMVAYSAASGALIADFATQFIGMDMRPWMGSLLFAILFGCLVYMGTGVVDQFNRILMSGLIISYGLLVVMGIKYVDSSLLMHRNWNAMTLVIPTVIISFGYHNLIPSLKTYYKGDMRTLTWAILIGSMIPLFIYLVWEGLILGLVPASNFQQALDQGAIATQALKEAVGASWVLDVAQAFAFFAIITSFLSVALSFVDFLADALKIEKTPIGKFILVLLVIGPSFLMALWYPTIFLTALTYAGGFGAVILFGILPALMVWMGRYRLQMEGPRLVPGGKIVLMAVMLFSLWVILLQFRT